jgi:hypothetical protein
LLALSLQPDITAVDSLHPGITGDACVVLLETTVGRTATVSVVAAISTAVVAAISTTVVVVISTTIVAVKVG